MRTDEVKTPRAGGQLPRSLAQCVCASNMFSQKYDESRVAELALSLRKCFEYYLPNTINLGLCLTYLTSVIVFIMCWSSAVSNLRSSLLHEEEGAPVMLSQSSRV